MDKMEAEQSALKSQMAEMAKALEVATKSEPRAADMAEEYKREPQPDVLKIKCKSPCTADAAKQALKPLVEDSGHTLEDITLSGRPLGTVFWLRWKCAPGFGSLRNKNVAAAPPEL